MEKIVRVTGRGKIAVKPDMTRIMIDMEGTYSNYEEAIAESASDTEKLMSVFETLGFHRSDLKTLNFHVDTVYESYQGEKGNWEKRFLGYRYMHSVKLEFDADNKMLGCILYQLSTLPFHPEFHIIYTVKDMEAAKNKLLAKAVEDSKAKAMILAESAGVTLGDIATIDYSWGEMEIAARPMNKRMALAPMAAMDTCGSYDINIEPDDIDVTDTVTVVWEIV